MCRGTRLSELLRVCSVLLGEGGKRVVTGEVEDGAGEKALSQIERTLYVML